MSDRPAPHNAHIQIETGVLDGHPEVHRVLIDGRNVSEQIRRIDFVVEGGETADVRVTYAHPHVSVLGDATVSETRHG